MTPVPPKPIRFGDLGLRLLSGTALAAIGLAGLWLGGLWFAALVALAAALMLWELYRMAAGDPALRAPALWLLCAAGAGAVLATTVFGLASGALVLAGGAALVATASSQARWLAPGLVYIGFAMCYLTALRASPVQGLPTVLWLILVVIATDVGAYFVGRRFGGPRLWPAVSPGKTWSGALGGLAIALLAGGAFGWAAGRGIWWVALLSLGVAIAAQCGDLLESAVKRRFGVKDASRLIPGHGGVLDRLDGLMGGLWFFALCDLLGVAGR